MTRVDFMPCKTQEFLGPLLLPLVFEWIIVTIDTFGLKLRNLTNLLRALEKTFDHQCRRRPIEQIELDEIACNKWWLQEKVDNLAYDLW